MRPAHMAAVAVQNKRPWPNSWHSTHMHYEASHCQQGALRSLPSAAQPAVQPGARAMHVPAMHVPAARTRWSYTTGYRQQAIGNRKYTRYTSTSLDPRKKKQTQISTTDKAVTYRIIKFNLQTRSFVDISVPTTPPNALEPVPPGPPPPTTLRVMNFARPRGFDLLPTLHEPSDYLDHPIRLTDVPTAGSSDADNMSTSSGSSCSPHQPPR